MSDLVVNPEDRFSQNEAHGIRHLKHVADTLQLSFKHKLSNLQEVILDSIEYFVQDNSQDLGQYNLVQDNLQDLGEICQLAII